jgi:hypothetical protein
MLLWIVTTIALEATKLTGVPIVIAAIILWPVSLFCSIKSARLRTQAQRQATEEVATWKRANVPVRSVEAFDKWASQSKYYRFRGESSGQDRNP